MDCCFCSSGSAIPREDGKLCCCVDCYIFKNGHRPIRIAPGTICTDCPFEQVEN